MTVVSSKEFKTNQDKYLDMAINERVFIRKGNYTFFVTNADDEDDDYADLLDAKAYADDENTSLADFKKYVSGLSK